MILRAIIIWFILMVIAIVNGAFRGAVLIPKFGELIGRIISTLLLCALILLTAILTIRWIGPSNPGQAWLVGLVWLGLTIAFEFLAGHYVFGNSWEQLLADYNVLRGRLWVLVPITTLVAPWLAARIRGM